MTSFVQVDYPTEHPGAVRAERPAVALKNAWRQARHGSLLLAAVVAAVLVVANQLIDTWSDGHLLAAWMLMWALAFGALAFLAAPAREVANNVGAALRRWRATRRQAEEDRKLWDLALQDARVMADISRAMSQSALRDVRYY